MKERILFARVDNFDYYDVKNISEDEKETENKKRRPTSRKETYEHNNFHKWDGGVYKGFFEPCHKKKEFKDDPDKYWKHLHLDRIDDKFKNKTEIDDVLIIFCTKHNDKNIKKLHVVGWYEHSKLWSVPQLHNGVDLKEEAYNCQTKQKYGVLLNKEEIKRERKTLWVPWANKKKAQVGFGRSWFWYAKENGAESIKKRITNYIKKYKGK